MDEHTIYTPTYSDLLVRFHGEDHHLIWYTFFEGPSKDGHLGRRWREPHVHSFHNLQRYAHQNNISITDEEEKAIDLDTIADWLTKPDPDTVDCESFLSTWNLFTDLTHSLEVPFRDRDPKANKIYDKLFWGNNLPAVTPECQQYEPVWTMSDIARMRQVMQRGLDVFHANMRIAAERTGH